MKNNQQGRITAKVVIILVVLAIGSAWFAVKTHRENQMNTMMSQISSLGATVGKQQKNAMKIVHSYNKNYALYLSKTNNLPSGLAYVNDVIPTENNAKIKANVDTNGVVIFEITNIDAKSCVKIVTTDFGMLQTTRFVGVGIGQKPDFGCLAQHSCKFNYIAAFSGTSDYPFAEYRAEVPCALEKPATVYLGYKLY
ncbi:MAG: hypothetical protein J6N45_05930 [Alphaproteobacteria bacterium]|nr:hypothetical protein [Alphaproteobacteria bacterium]